MTKLDEAVENVIDADDLYARLSESINCKKLSDEITIYIGTIEKQNNIIEHQDKLIEQKQEFIELGEKMIEQQEKLLKQKEKMIEQTKMLI